MDSRLFLLVGVFMGVLLEGTSAAIDKQKCEWHNETGKNFIEEAPYIDTGISDPEICLTRCMSTVPNCFSVRYSADESSCRYSYREYDEVELTVNSKVQVFLLKCPGLFPIKNEYIAMAGMGGMILLLLLTNIVIICVLSGRRK